MGTPLRVLLVEDYEADAELVLLELRRGGYDLTVERVDTSNSMARALEEESWDLVISDYVMPSFSGLAALALLKKTEIDIPFIVVSGKIGENVAVEAMKAGAHDYIMKDNLARLAPAIQRELNDAAIRKERRQMEEQLQRAQRLELAGRIAAQVAHDFTNLLSPLFGYPQIIKKLLPVEHPAVKYCDALLNNVRQMSAINEDLLTLGRRGRSHQETTEMNYVVQQALGQMYERAAAVTVEAHLTPDLHTVSGSPAQLLRVVVNLISNALEAMGDGGTLTLRTENVRQERPFGRYNRIEAGEYVKLEVGDTGPGIPNEIANRIFDPFFTTKRTDEQKGSGLGLSIVQTIVSDHQGYVDLETTLGEGTSFSIYLPIHRETARETPAETTQGGAGALAK